MTERGFRPWVVTLVVCVGVALVLVVWINGSGGFADPPWFLAVGVGVGVTLACLWLIARSLIGWRWVQEDTPPGEEPLTAEDGVAAYQGRLADINSLDRFVVPVLHAALRERLRRHHALDLDDPADAERVHALVPARLLAVVAHERALTPHDLPRVLDELDALTPDLTRPPTDRRREP